MMNSLIAQEFECVKGDKTASDGVENNKILGSFASEKGISCNGQDAESERFGHRNYFAH